MLRDYFGFGNNSLGRLSQKVFIFLFYFSVFLFSIIKIFRVLRLITYLDVN